MGERKLEVNRSEGWDQEKGEGYEQITCPMCGYNATAYARGDVVVWRERDPACPCCSGAEFELAFDDDDSVQSSSSEEEGGCGLALFGLLLVGIGLIVFLVNTFGPFR